LKDGVTYGTSLKLVGIQVITVNGTAGVDTGDLDEVEVAAIFGQTKGYKTSEPNVTPKVTEEIDEDDMEF
ncbi:MAG: single-stranded DNA-binding protein, partial [Candidatus Nanopelagicaceae bacterium]